MTKKRKTLVIFDYFSGFQDQMAQSCEVITGRQTRKCWEFFKTIRSVPLLIISEQGVLKPFQCLEITHKYFPSNKILEKGENEENTCNSI